MGGDRWRLCKGYDELCDSRGINARVAQQASKWAQKVQLDLLDYPLWSSSYFIRYNSYP